MVRERGLDGTAVLSGQMRDGQRVELQKDRGTPRWGMKNWCRRRGSNPHDAKHHWILSSSKAIPHVSRFQLT